MINSDTIYSGTKAENKSVKFERTIEAYRLHKFESNESEVGTPYVDSDRDGKKEIIQLNFYSPEFYTSDSTNSEKDYLPVLIHEMAHMTERSSGDEVDKAENLDTGLLFEYFDSDSVYRQRIIAENNLLLRALDSQKEMVSDLLTQYFKLQSERVAISPSSIMDIEAIIEASEGYARYIEYLCKTNLTSHVIKNLTGFDVSVSQYELENEKWMYDVLHTNGYIYCTGFNKIRLLRKYQGDEFLNIYTGKEEKSLDKYLKKMIKRL